MIKTPITIRLCRKLNAYWKQLPIENRGSIAISIPLVCLLGSVIADSILRQRIIEAQQYVNHTNQVLVESQTALISLLNAETGVRGYFIGKQDIFLGPYNEALTSVKPTIAKLEKLVQDNPIQVKRVEQLTQISQYRMSLLQGTVERVKTGKIGDAELTTERLIRGKVAMDEFRNVISQVETEERRRLVVRTQGLQDQQNINAVVMWTGIMISLFGTAITLQLLKQLSMELKEREARLLESRNLIQAIVANVVDSVMVINTQDQIETFNHSAVEMFGYSSTEAIGLSWQKLLNPDSSTDNTTMFNRPNSISTSLPIGEFWQAMGQRKSREWFPIEASINDIALDTDRILIIRDITERQQAAAKLQAKTAELTVLNASLTLSNQSLLQLNQELDQFAYVTAHDLKAPLRAIASLSEWIEEDLLQELGHDLSENIRSNFTLLRRRVFRMQALLNSLLEYSRAGRQNIAIVPVDVSDLLNQIIQSIDPPSTFTIHIITPMPKLETRLQALQQVFTHLIDNAIRHHPSNVGIIEISAIDQGDRYEFSISDNGEGIDIQFQERIYTIFQTLKARDLKENIGAGLAIIKKTIESEGGTIILESKVGSGSIFRFTWLKESNLKPMTTALDTP